jgi:hypothetical protein
LRQPNVFVLYPHFDTVFTVLFRANQKNRRCCCGFVFYLLPYNFLFLLMLCSLLSFRKFVKRLKIR